MKSQPGFWYKKSTYCWGLAAILLLFLLVFFQQKIVLAAKEAISGESAGLEPLVKSYLNIEDKNSNTINNLVNQNAG